MITFEFEFDAEGLKKRIMEAAMQKAKEDVELTLMRNGLDHLQVHCTKLGERVTFCITGPREDIQKAEDLFQC